MVYPLMNKNKIMQYRRKQINRVDWERWMGTITSTIIPVSETEEWIQILEYGRELYGDDPIVAMQEEYNRLSRKKEDHLLKGQTPLEVHGTTTSKSGARVPVIIYGEKHDQIDNAFYKKHSFDQRKDMAIWVEHDPLTCNTISTMNKQIRHTLKGSLWIRFERVIHHLPVTCIDIRMEDIDSLITDDALRYVVNIPVEYNDPDIIVLRDKIIATYKLDTISNLLSFLEKRIKQYEKIMSAAHLLTSFYTKYMRIIRKQLQEIHSIIERNLDPNGSIFYKLLQHIVLNIFMLQSILVDGHIITLLQTYKGTKPIAIFVGLYHAIRLAHFLDWKIIPNDTFDYQSIKEMAYTTLTPMVLEKKSSTKKSSTKKSIQHSTKKHNNHKKIKNMRSYKQKKSYQRPRNYTRKR